MVGTTTLEVTTTASEGARLDVEGVYCDGVEVSGIDGDAIQLQGAIQRGAEGTALGSTITTNGIHALAVAPWTVDMPLAELWTKKTVVGSGEPTVTLHHTRRHRGSAAPAVTTDLSPLDPRTVPALMAGGIWLPSTPTVDLGGGNRAWPSLGTQANSFTDEHTGHKPLLTTAANGAPVWDLPAGGATASWVIPTVGSALKWTSKGTYAGWFKANALDESYHYFFAQWEGGASGNNRILCHKNNDEHRVAIFASHEGSTVDAVAPPDIGGRCKWNSSAGPGIGMLVDWTEWNFIRITVDMDLDNYSIGGANHSRRLRVWINEVEIVDVDGDGGGQFSAPQPDVGGAPPDGPFKGLYGGVDLTWFALGADYVSSQWNGQLGPFYAANGEASEHRWRRIMAWDAPA